VRADGAKSVLSCSYLVLRAGVYQKGGERKKGDDVKELTTRATLGRFRTGRTEEGPTLHNQKAVQWKWLEGTQNAAEKKPGKSF